MHATFSWGVTESKCEPQMADAVGKDTERFVTETDRREIAQ